MNIAYECKFCQKPGVVTIDDPEAMFQVPKWKHLLSCNRCADYMERKRGFFERIRAATATLQQFRLTMTSEKLMPAEAKIREKLTAITKGLASLVCDYYRKTNVWEAEFVNLLMDKPERVIEISNRYVRDIKTIV